MTGANWSGQPDGRMIQNYFKSLVNMFFKILPLKEEGDPSIDLYMKSLQRELLGCAAMSQMLDYDPQLFSLTAILQYLIDHPDCPVREVRREVFRAISICNKLRAKCELITQSRRTEAGQ